MPPSPAAPNLSRRALAALALVAGLTFISGAGASAQVPTTTVPGVLVPGDTTAATVATTTTTTEAPAVVDDGLLDFDLDANEKVWIIVGALVAVAALLLVLTIIYWRHTKPDRPKADRRIERAERKEQKQRRRAAIKDETDDGDGPAGTPSAPMDLDEVLSSPDPARSVFGIPDEPEESPR
jgi:beta-lactamase regulating signal transducer with metallopeptidase domain